MLARPVGAVWSAADAIPLLRHRLHAALDLAETLLQPQSGRIERGQPIVAERAADCDRIPAHQGRRWGVLLRPSARNRAHSAQALLPLLLRMPISLGDQRGRRLQVGKLAELMRHIRQRLRNRVAHRRLTIRDAPDDWYGKRLLDRSQQRRAVVSGGRQQAARQQEGAGQPVAHSPEDFVPHRRLQAIECQHHLPSRLRRRPEPGRVVQRQRHQLIIAVEHVGHPALADRQVAGLESLVDRRDAGVLLGAETADFGDDITAKRVLRQALAPLGLGTVGCVRAWAGRRAALLHAQAQLDHPLQRDHPSAIGIRSPGRSTAERTGWLQALQHLAAHSRRAIQAFPARLLHETAMCRYPTSSVGSRQADFAGLDKNSS